MKLPISAFIMIVGMMYTSSAQASCSAYIVRAGGNGEVLTPAAGYSSNFLRSCSKANKRCQRELLRKQSLGLLPRAVCLNENELRQRPVHRPRPHLGRVTRTCQVSASGPRGRRVFRIFDGVSTGRRGTGVIQQACQRAQQQCRRWKRRNARPRILCTITGRQ